MFICLLDMIKYVQEVPTTKWPLLLGVLHLTMRTPILHLGITG